MRRFTLCLIVLFASNAAADDVANPLAALQMVVQEITEQSSPAIVSIARVVPSAEVPLPGDFDPFDSLENSPGNRSDGPVADGFGSGIILRVEDSRRLYVLTNHHVITGRLGRSEATDDKLFVRTVGGFTLPATVFAFDPRSDLGVLVADLNELTAETLKISPLSFGDGDNLQRGQFVIALGNPAAIVRDGTCSVQWGMISNLSRRPAPVPDQDLINSNATIHQMGNLLQLDMRLPVGMSGGAILNLKGELVGLTTALPSLQDDATPAGLAIPMTSGIRRIIETLLKGEEVEYGFLGIDPDNSAADELRLARPFLKQSRCARVSRMARKSPAAAAGLREGDLVYKVNEQLVTDQGDLVRIVGLLGPEANAELYVYRPATRQFVTLSVSLGKWPMYNDERLITSHQRHPDWRGLQVDYPTGRFRYLPDAFLSTYPSGVTITGVAGNSPAAAAGLRVGQTIDQIAGQEVGTPAEFHRVVQELKGTVTLSVSGQSAIIAEP